MSACGPSFMVEHLKRSDLRFAAPEVHDEVCAVKEIRVVLDKIDR